jgi:hypothetical protein
MAREPILPSLHAGAFAAIPVPATLLDAKGLIVDLNDAFLHLGRRAILDFLSAGKPAEWQQVENETAGSKGLRNMRMLARRDADGAVCGALVLREEVTDAGE